jgi:hypothetical protein
MNEKSHVSLEQRVCLVCANPFESGSILIDRYLRASLDKHTITGWGLCPEHKELFDAGYVALVECDPEKSGCPAAGDLVQPGRAYRTGKLVYIKRDAFNRMFDLPLKDTQPCVYVEQGVIAMFEALAKSSPH